MERITFVEKGSRTIYRLGRRIVCYRDGYRVYFGKPSDVTRNTFDALSENIAHEYCLKVCERKKWDRVKCSNPSDIINQIIKDYEEILRISHRTFEQGSQR